MPGMEAKYHHISAQSTDSMNTAPQLKGSSNWKAKMLTNVDHLNSDWHNRPYIPAKI